MFGAILIYSGIKLFGNRSRTIDPEKNHCCGLFASSSRSPRHYEGDKFFVRRGAVTYATPLAIVLMVVETTDLLFATDSIPAVLAVTHEPFIVYTSNAFAILGLRSLYFALAGMIEMFHLPALWAVCDSDFHWGQDAGFELCADSDRRRTRNGGRHVADFDCALPGVSGEEGGAVSGAIRSGYSASPQMTNACGTWHRFSAGNPGDSGRRGSPHGPGRIAQSISRFQNVGGFARERRLPEPGSCCCNPVKLSQRPRVALAVAHDAHVLPHPRLHIPDEGLDFGTLPLHRGQWGAV